MATSFLTSSYERYQKHRRAAFIVNLVLPWLGLLPIMFSPEMRMQYEIASEQVGDLLPIPFMFVGLALIGLLYPLTTPGRMLKNRYFRYGYRLERGQYNQWERMILTGLIPLPWSMLAIALVGAFGLFVCDTILTPVTQWAWLRYLYPLVFDLLVLATHAGSKVPLDMLAELERQVMEGGPLMAKEGK